MLLRVTLAVCLAAAPGLAAAQSFAPPDWADGVKLNELVDRNPDPKIVEIDLTAKLADVQIDGKTVHAWTYDGGIPGPLIKTHVGDRLIVHFKNELDEPTTVHWHGVRVPIEMDGVPGHLAARGEERRVVHLRLRRARCRACTGITRT